MVRSLPRVATALRLEKSPGREVAATAGRPWFADANCGAVGAGEMLLLVLHASGLKVPVAVRSHFAGGRTGIDAAAAAVVADAIVAVVATRCGCRCCECY